MESDELQPQHSSEKQDAEDEPASKQPSTEAVEVNVKQGLEEAAVMELTKEQDGESKVKQGLAEASVKRLPMEQTGSSIEDQDLVEVPKVATKRLGVEERRIAWEGSKAEFTESNMIMAMSTGIGDHSNKLH